MAVCCVDITVILLPPSDTHKHRYCAHNTGEDTKVSAGRDPAKLPGRVRSKPRDVFDLAVLAFRT